MSPKGVLDPTNSPRPSVLVSERPIVTLLERCFHSLSIETYGFNAKTVPQPPSHDGLPPK
jgi:hypothetical protein